MMNVPGKLNLPMPKTLGDISDHLDKGGIVITQNSDGDLKFYVKPTNQQSIELANVLAFGNASNIHLIYLLTPDNR